MVTTPILPELQWRGLVADMAHREELEKLLAPGAAPLTLYVGFDPTADSLHLGHLIGLLLLPAARAQTSSQGSPPQRSAPVLKVCGRWR